MIIAHKKARLVYQMNKLINSQSLILYKQKNEWSSLNMFKVSQVKALPNYRLWLKYNDGTEGEVDLSYLVGKGVFSIWKNIDNFKKVYIGSSGQIAWSDQIDLCPDAIYMKITKKTPEEVFQNLKYEEVNARN